MSVSKKHFIRYYTIIEVMMAMGIFLVMMTIMMQFFTSAQQIWNKSSKRNAIYADARVAMNLMTREIQCMLYENSEDGDCYPFWYEYTRVNADGEDRTGLETYFTSNNDFQSDFDGYAFLTSLNFISTTDLKSVDKGSDICEIRYKFIPVYLKSTATAPYSINDIEGGILQRSCLGEYSYDSVSATDILTNDVDTSIPDRPYDFSKYTLNGGVSNRVVEIWKYTSLAGFKTVINGVYSLNFTCYKWDGTNIGVLEAMDVSGNAPDDGNGPNDGYTLATGTTAPVAIRIDMKLLDPEDLKKFAVAIANSDSKQIALYRRKIRTFSKVIYLGKLEN